MTNVYAELMLITTETPDGPFHIIADNGGLARASGFGDVGMLRQRLPVELRLLDMEVAKKPPVPGFGASLL
jgi:hypothetical protein